MSKIALFDLDGTLADGRHRLHMIPAPELRSNTENWVPFNRASIFDEVILPTVELLRMVYFNGAAEVYILTGRSNHVYKETLDWLDKHNIPFHKLIMRDKTDNRTDIEFKDEEIKKIGVENIWFAVDDLPHIVHHMRGLGITTYQCAENTGV